MDVETDGIGAGDKRDFSVGDVSEVLACLESVGVRCWLDGGWGVDALVGAQTRVHDDLDLVLAADDVARASAALAGIGFHHAAEIEPGLPARFVLLDGGGRQVDIHRVVFDSERNGWQPLGDGAWAQYPADGLAGTGQVGDRRVECVTASLQLRHHLGYPWDEQDRADMEVLGHRFGLALPPKAV
jgi:lincosamide nucleotidyltransferase A/C/D/E